MENSPSRISANFGDKLGRCVVGVKNLPEKRITGVSPGTGIGNRNGKRGLFFQGAHGGTNYSSFAEMITTQTNASPKQPAKRKMAVIDMADDDVSITNKEPCSGPVTIEENSACRHCGKKFSIGQGLALIKHERRCTANSTVDTEKFACDICLKFTFKTLAEWTEHRQLHFEGSRFKCPRCEKIFTAIAGVENHLPYCRGRQSQSQVQEQQKPPPVSVKSKCVFCQKVPNTDITSHVINNHSQSIMILCVCGQLSMGHRLHKEHVSTCRSLVKTMYVCEFCETFMSSCKDELLDHKRNYHGPIPINANIETANNLNSNQPMGTVNLSLNVINSLMRTTSTTEVASQSLLPSLIQLADTTSITIPSAPELVPGPSVTKSKVNRNRILKQKLTISRPPQLTQKPVMSGNRSTKTNASTTKITKPMMTISKPTLTPPPLVKIPGKNHNNFAKCIDSYEFKTNECKKCGKKFFMKAGLDLHTVQCDGKFVFKFHEYNIQEKDCAFLLALN